MSLLEPLFLSPEEILSDTTIGEIERAGGIILADLTRTVLRTIVRVYLFQRRCARPTQKEARHERYQKSLFKSQQLRQKKLASALETAATLLDEDLQQGVLSTNSVAFKVVNLKMPCPISLPETVQHLRALAQAARVQQHPAEQTVRWCKDSRGRPPDGLNELIQQFAIVYHLSGGKLTSGTDPDSGRGRITPVVEAAKVLIDALPEYCPKRDLITIADRVKDQKLFATIKRGKIPRK